MTVVMDCDFLSSFLKIDRIDLVKRVYGVDRVSITTGVYQEISSTSLKEALDRRDDVQIETVPGETIPDEPGLGLGERESIAFAQHAYDSVLLMNDTGSNGFCGVREPALTLGLWTLRFFRRILETRHVSK